MRSLFSDLRFAIRQMRRSPGFALTVVLTLALGIGANAVVFGILNALILRPLNLPNAHQLYTLDRAERSGVSPSHSYPDYLDLRDRNAAFTGIAASHINIVGIQYGHTARRSWFYEASGNYFDLLGVEPYLGRFFHPADIHGAGSAPFAVLSYDFWHSQLNADPAVIGTVIELNKHPYTILGVAPASFIGTELFFRPDIWVPMVQEQQLEGYDFLGSRGDEGIWLIGRLKPGVTPATATANLNAIARQMATEHTEDETLAIKLSKPGLVGDTLGRPVAAFLFGVMLLAGLVFVAACANLGSLFSARAGDRARELALRLALGSTRARILRQLVVEALVLSSVGGALGLAVGTALLRGLSQWSPPGDLPIHVAVSADARTMLLTFALALASGLFFGLIPAAGLWRGESYQLIKTGSVTGLRRSRFSLRSALLLLQIALCAVLVTSSLVAVRGLARSLHMPLGFNPEGVTLARFDLKMIDQTGDQTLQFQRQAAERAAQLPGVVSAAFSNTVPLGIDSSFTTIYRDGTTDFKLSNSVVGAYYLNISPGYLATVRTRLLSGREFNWQDTAKSPPVVIINQRLARLLFGDALPVREAVGRYLVRGGRRTEIVGVMEDGKYETLTEDPAAATYFPMTQMLDGNTTLIVRSSTPATASAVAALLHGMSPGLPVKVDAWTTALGWVLLPAQVATVALGVMGLLAAMLALTGIFGMASYTVSQRLRELGIRIALGATRRQILAAALKHPVQLLVAGSFVGLVLGALADRLLASIVYQATSRDPVVLLGVLAGMAMVGAIAAWLPARRALAIDPATLLRED